MNYKRLIRLAGNLLLFSLLTFISTQCSTSLRRFPAGTTSVDISSRNILVVAYDNALNSGLAEKGFAGGVANAAGTIKVLPTVPDSLKGVSSAFAGYGLNNNGAVNTSDSKMALINEIVALSSGIGSNFDYILIASIEPGNNSVLLPTVKTVRYLASLYDVNNRRVAAAVESTGPLPGTGDAGVVTAAGKSLVSKLLTGQ
ncbi:MAG: hypothetical protein KDK41_13820 [Leptospiraceae bacterium]|nr:hypothetical protein [Leptospiraceae bacterium]